MQKKNAILNSTQCLQDKKEQQSKNAIQFNKKKNTTQKMIKEKKTAEEWQTHFFV